MSPTGTPLAGPPGSRRAIHPATALAIVPGNVNAWPKLSLVQTGYAFQRAGVGTDVYVGNLIVHQVTGARVAELTQLAGYTVRDLIVDSSTSQIYALTDEPRLWSINPGPGYTTLWSVVPANYTDHPQSHLLLALTGSVFLGRGYDGKSTRYSTTDGSLTAAGDFEAADSIDSTGWIAVGPSQQKGGTGTWGQLAQINTGAATISAVYSVTGNLSSSPPLTGIAYANPSGGEMYVCGPSGVYRLTIGVGFLTGIAWHESTIPAKRMCFALNPAGTGYDLYVIGARSNAWTGSAGRYATIWRLDQSGAIQWAYDTAAGDGDGEPLDVIARSVDGVRRVWIATEETAEYDFVS